MLLHQRICLKLGESRVGVGITEVITEGSLDVPWGLNDGGTKVLVTLDNHQLVAVGRKRGQSTELVRQEVGLALALKKSSGSCCPKTSIRSWMVWGISHLGGVQVEGRYNLVKTSSSSSSFSLQQRRS